MKINWILAIISLGIAALAGYGFYAGTENLFLTFGGGGFLFVTLCGIIAVSFGRGSANIKVLSLIFFVLSFVEHLIFAFAGFRQAAYIISTGILFLLYLMIFYVVAKSIMEKLSVEKTTRTEVRA